MSEAGTTLIVVRDDPALSRRPAEALRIAVGLRVGESSVEIVLLGLAARCLAEDVSGFADAELLETHRRALARSGQFFLAEEGALRAHPPGPGFRAEPLGAGELAARLAAAARHILF